MMANFADNNIINIYNVLIKKIIIRGDAMLIISITFRLIKSPNFPFTFPALMLRYNQL